MSGLINIPSDLNRERLLNTAQTAEFLGMSVPHFRRLYRAKKVPTPIKIGERKYGWRLGRPYRLCDRESWEALNEALSRKAKPGPARQRGKPGE